MKRCSRFQTYARSGVLVRIASYIRRWSSNSCSARFRCVMSLAMPIHSSIRAFGIEHGHRARVHPADGAVGAEHAMLGVERDLVARWRRRLRGARARDRPETRSVRTSRGSAARRFPRTSGLRAGAARGSPRSFERPRRRWRSPMRESAPHFLQVPAPLTSAPLPALSSGRTGCNTRGAGGKR